MCKKFIFLTSLMLMFGLAEAEAQESYIIVHAVNPEGVEIASIEGMNYYDIEIYDGDTLIEYGAHSAETHNSLIAISAGTHNIKAKFNGMTKEQTITLNPNETKTLIFTFPRVEISNSILTRSSLLNLYHYDPEFLPGYGLYTRYEQYNTDGMGGSMGALLTSWIPTDPEDYPNNSMVTFGGSMTLEQIANLQFQSSLDFITYNYEIHTIVSPLFPGFIVQVQYHEFGSWGLWEYRSGPSFPINILPQTFNNWHIQINPSEKTTGIVELDGTSLISLGTLGYDYKIINANVLYSYIKFSAFDAVYDDADYDYGYMWEIRSLNTEGSQSFYIGGSTLKMSSVPYDLLGTGIHCGGGVEEPPECAFSAKDPVWQNEADEMVLPYDEVDLKFTFTNTTSNPVTNVRVDFIDNDLVDFVKDSDAKGSIAPGGTFTATNTVRIADTDNPRIMEEIINVGGSGRLSLKDMIDVHVTADECSAPCEFRLSPTDEKDNILSIQYPDFSNLAGTPVPSDDEGGFYRDQGDIDFHHPRVDLVRKYAVEASVWPGRVFPDEVSHVVQNIYNYIDSHLGDDPEGIIRRDEEIVQILPNVTEKHACISQAYLFGSFARTIGVPAREMDVALGVSIWELGHLVFGVRYDQEAAIQVWYDHDWHFYDTFLEKDSMKSYLTGTGYVKYRAWHSYDRRYDEYPFLPGKGHDFSITGFGTPKLFSGWKHLQDGVKEGLIVVIGSPVHTYLCDGEGNITGYMEGSILEEIPNSYYVAAGSRFSTNAADSTAFWEADETIFAPSTGSSGDYSLVMTGTDDGHYELTLAYIHQDGDIDGSTVQFDIRKDEKHTYDITVSPSGQISITGVPAHIDINPNRTPNQVYLSKNYTIYVAVLGSATFNVSDIDSSTVRFGRNGTEAKPVRAPTMRDLNADGFIDAMYGFMTFNCGFQLGDTEGILTGETTNEIKIIGCDSVLVSN